MHPKTSGAGNSDKTLKLGAADSEEKERFTHGEKVSHKIDHASLIVFPVVFVIFAINYWVFYGNSVQFDIPNGTLIQ